MTINNPIKLCIAVSIFIFLLSSCKEESEIQEIVRPVRTIEAVLTEGIYVRTFTGVAQAGTESKLSFKVPGTIKNIAVRVGSKVKVGQILSELDPGDYELRLQQAESSLLQGKAQARNADVNYDRTRILYEKKSTSLSDLDAARMTSEAANANVQTLEKQLELARMQLNYTKIKAPLDGAIAEVVAEINENVQAGMPIITLTSGSHIEVKVAVPSSLISMIEEKKLVSVKFDAVPNKEFLAIVSEIGVKSTGTATTFPVTLLLSKPDPEIRAGMVAAAEFHFTLTDQNVRFIIPSEAVGEDREGRFVFVVEPLAEEEGFGIIKRKPVQVGELTSEGLEIFEGLTEGDLVVTAGISHISDGQKVKL
jgi:multidrug efflux system membrane fusion protein